MAAVPDGRRPSRLFLDEGSDSPTHRLIERIALAIGRRNQPTRGDVVLDRRRIYILPSRAGLLFAGAMVAMLLAAVNYSLALGYVLTFVLTSIGLVSMLHTYRNLAGLVLRPGRTDSVHAGELAEMHLTLINRSRQARYAVQIESPASAAPVMHDVAAEAERIAVVTLHTSRRGWMPAPRFRLSTTFPLGLWRAWSYWHPATRVLVWPQPETPAAPLPAAVSDGGEFDDRSHGDDDFSAIRPYRPGDSLRRLAWKAMARTADDEPLTKAFAGGSGGELLLDWNQLPAGMPDEARLSRLTRWVLRADAEGQRFVLILPGQRLDADAGSGHRGACLEALALCGRTGHTGGSGRG
ncbi:MAG: DUF58 domain-containing protein [Lautropia sp.]